jgi:DNA-directed RNA polymerase specialized sigma24 family protein
MTPDVRARLAGALGALSERELLLLALSRIDGLVPAELACVLGGTEAAAARDLHLAQRRVARQTGAAPVSSNPKSSPRQAPTGAPRTREEKTRWQA